MAKFDAKTFNPQAFGQYMEAVPNERLNKLRSSKVLARNAVLREMFKNNSQTGTAYGVIPYFGTLSGKAQNYDGTHDITSQTTSTYEQGVFTYGRMQSWTEKDFSYDITGGADFMANIRSQVNEYFDYVDQSALLSILKGVFAMSETGSGNVQKANAEFVTEHTTDISKEGDTKTVPEMLVSATTLNTAIQKACGDHKQKFSVMFCHSAVSTNLENLNLLQHLKYTDDKGIERDLELATWNGKLVIVDDSMPAEVKGGSNPHTLYTTYVLGNGAFAFEDVGAKVPYEMERDAKKHGGEDSLIVRKRHAVGVNGISYLKAVQASNSPEDEELANGANWSVVNDGTNAINPKTIPIARIISRG